MQALETACSWRGNLPGAALVGEPGLPGSVPGNKALSRGGNTFKVHAGRIFALLYAARIADQGAPRACYRRIGRDEMLEGTVADCAHGLRHGDVLDHDVGQAAERFTGSHTGAILPVAILAADRAGDVPESPRSLPLL